MKIFGEGSNRLDRTARVLDEVDRSGSHWACTYPKGKRPRQAREGDVMYLGRLVRGPTDIIIFGRAIALRRHVEGEDDASPGDIARRSWKADWPHYVRVHSAEFLDGAIGDGVSLNELMDTLKADAFTKTQENAAADTGNTNPRRAYSQRSDSAAKAQNGSGRESRTPSGAPAPSRKRRSTPWTGPRAPETGEPRALRTWCYPR